jgi:hypothetical protein
VELRDERRAGEDEQTAHDDRAEDAPEEHAVLVLGRHAERAEQHEEDEEVVDRQRPPRPRSRS